MSTSAGKSRARTGRCLAAILAGLAGCSPPEGSAEPLEPEPVQIARDDAAFAYRDVIRRVEGWVAEGAAVGAELMIVEGGEPIFHGSWGARDRERELPWTRDTICCIRSLTKPVLATAVLLLHERGVLTIDDRVSKFLPEFDGKRWGDLRISQLLSHTAGLDHPGNPRPLRSYPDLCSAVADIALAGHPLRRSDEQRYSSAGYLILGCLVTRATGRPVEEFLRTELFEPLGMRDTHCTFERGAPWADRVASSYERSPTNLGFRRVWDNTMRPELPWFRGSGGLYSTVSDYARFLQFWMKAARGEDDTPLSAVLLDRALRPPKGIREEQGARNLVWKLYGNRGATPQYPAPFGHTGADESAVLASPARDLAMIYFTQSRGGGTIGEFTGTVGELLRARTE